MTELKIQVQNHRKVFKEHRAKSLHNQYLVFFMKFCVSNFSNYMTSQNFFILWQTHDKYETVYLLKLQNTKVVEL